MKSCPICGSVYEKKNDCKGIYYQCVRCNSRVYSLSLLKRLDFKHQIFTNFLMSAKQNQTKFSGNCLSCKQPYREVDYETNDYQTSIYVCPTCFLFAIKYLDLPLFRDKVQQLKIPKKRYSAETENLLEDLDTKITDSNNSWEAFDQSIKISKSKSIGFSAFMVGLVIAFVRIGFTYAIPTTIGKIFFVLMFVLSMLVGLYFFIGRKNTIKIIKKYFSRL